MFAFLQRLVRRGPSAAELRALGPRSVHAAPPPPVDLHTLHADYLAALGLAPVEPPALTALQQQSVARLAEELKHRLLRDAPGPEAFPAQYMQVLRQVSDPAVGLAEISRLIAQEPALSASVLRVANSAFYRGAQPSQTLREATSRLGAAEVGRMAGVISVHMLYQWKKKTTPQLDAAFAECHRHAVTTALASSWFALKRRDAKSDRTYLGGLLHDAGRAMALRAAVSLSAQPNATVRLDDPLLPRAIDAVHAAAGAEMARRWSLPPLVEQICSQHHGADLPGTPELVDLHIVRLVSAVRLVRLDPIFAARAADEIAQSGSVLAVTPSGLRALDAEVRLLEKKASSWLAS